MISIELEKNIDPSLLSGRATKLEQALAWQIMKDTNDFVPALTLSFANRSRVVGNRIIYPGPDARYLHEGKVMVNSKTGKGPMKIPEVGYRWPLGAILVATSRNLKVNTSVHANATDHWMDASKRKNMNRWKRMGAKIYTDGK